MLETAAPGDLGLKELIGLLTIPLFSGAIGYATNWTGVWMLFHPLRFRGFRLPGLAPLAKLLPRRVQQIPGVMVGGVGWQGIIPSRAAKMGSIAVDKGIAKVGSGRDFYDQLDREALAEHVLASAREEIHELVERVMVRGRPQLWRALPRRLRARIHRRVEEQLPEVIPEVVDAPVDARAHPPARGGAAARGHPRGRRRDRGQ